jgi:hypothetical protein
MVPMSAIANLNCREAQFSPHNKTTTTKAIATSNLKAFPKPLRNQPCQGKEQEKSSSPKF